MIHLSEDELLQHALDFEDDPAKRAEADAHITSCQSCSAQLEQVHRDLAIISGIKPRKQPQLLPGRHQPHSTRLYFGVAALVVLSFAAGFYASELVERKPASVVPSTLVPASPDLSHATQSQSDATQVTYPESAVTAPGIR